MGKGFVTVLFIILFAFGKTEVKSQENNNKQDILKIESIYSDGLEVTARLYYFCQNGVLFNHP